MFAAIVGQSWATGSHPFNLEINGIDHIASVPTHTIRVEMAGPGTNGSLTFMLEDPTSAVGVTEWDEVRLIEHAATRPLQFGGFVQSIRYEIWATGGRTLVVTCAGYGVLLDKKAVPAFDTDPGESIYALDQRLVSLVNRHGGRITGHSAGASFVPTGAETRGLPSGNPSNWFSIPGYGNSWLKDSNLSDPFAVPANLTLRAAIEYELEHSGHPGGAVYNPVSTAYWVGADCRLYAFPTLLNPAAEPSPGWFDNQFDEGTVPGVTVDLTGASYTVVRVSYEREDSDRATSVYVVGGDANGTGFWRTQGLERAGDLDTIVTDTLSTSSAGIQSAGGAEVLNTAGATTRGTVVIESNTAQPFWPGRHLTITVAQAGLAGDDWRITAVEIDYGPGTHRTYSIGFGASSAHRPSIARRQGRLVHKRRNQRT